MHGQAFTSKPGVMHSRLKSGVPKRRFIILPVSMLILRGTFNEEAADAARV